jgi:hypothetical protein
MPNPLSNRKKVRGGRRQIARVETWARNLVELDVAAMLLRDGSVHAKLVIAPWYRLTKRNPPVWLRRRMFDGLLRVFHAWRARFESEQMRVCLRIWITHPDFIASRVVAEIDGGETSAFLPEASPTRPFPRELLSTTPASVDQFSWTAHAHEDHADDDDFAGKDELDRWRQRSWRQFPSRNGGTTYAVRRGDTWVGSWRSA